MEKKIKFTQSVKEFFKEGFFRPTTRHGSGRYVQNYTSAGWDTDYRGEILVLKELGMKLGKHYVTGNDAPRGGKCGDFVKLLSAAKRLKFVKELNKENK